MLTVESDLSAKRNLGLVLARLHGWRKIVFLDDDIEPVGMRALARIAGAIGRVSNGWNDDSAISGQFCEFAMLAASPNSGKTSLSRVPF